MSSDTAMVAMGVGGGFCIIEMSERVQSVYDEDPHTIEAFLEHGCPGSYGLWVWEGDYEDDDANGSWRRPTLAEIDELQQEIAS